MFISISCNMKDSLIEIKDKTYDSVKTYVDAVVLCGELHEKDVLCNVYRDEYVPIICDYCFRDHAFKEIYSNVINDNVFRKHKNQSKRIAFVIDTKDYAVVSAKQRYMTMK